jgi:hypothetical protein
MVDWLNPTLTIPLFDFLWKVEHSLHNTYSLYNVGCLIGINCTNPSHHGELLFDITSIVK